MNEKEHKPANRVLSFLGFSLLVVAVFLALNCARLYIWPEYGRFGDAEIGRFFVTVVSTFLVPGAVISGILLTRFANRSWNVRLFGSILAGVTTAAMMVPMFFVIYSMRPVPKYNPQNYQHLVGQHLRDARAKLDCKHSVSGSVSENGVSSRFLSLRGMEIVATPDGIITGVKQGRRD